MFGQPVCFDYNKQVLSNSRWWQRCIIKQ